jgi:glycogen(starch) synthase
LAYKRSKTLIVLSAYTRGLLKRTLGDRVQIELIPHGVNIEEYSPRLDSNPFRRLYGLGDDFVVLFLGYIRHFKGLEYLLRAFRSFRRRHSTGKLIIVGGSEQGGRDLSLGVPYRTFIRGEVDKLGLGQDVTITGYVENQIFRQALREADVTVFPYIRSFQSGTLPKAMSSGGATIVTTAGGLAEMVQPGLTGLTVRPGDSAELADALSRLYLDEAFRKGLGLAARSFAIAYLAWPKIARAHMAVYTDAEDRRQ